MCDICWHMTLFHIYRFIVGCTNKVEIVMVWLLKHICILETFSGAHPTRDDLHHGDTFLKDKFTTQDPHIMEINHSHILTDIIAQECLFDMILCVCVCRFS